MDSGNNPEFVNNNSHLEWDYGTDGVDDRLFLNSDMNGKFAYVMDAKNISLSDTLESIEVLNSAFTENVDNYLQKDLGSDALECIEMFSSVDNCLQNERKSGSRRDEQESTRLHHSLHSSVRHSSSDTTSANLLKSFTTEAVNISDPFLGTHICNAEFYYLNEKKITVPSTHVVFESPIRITVSPKDVLSLICDVIQTTGGYSASQIGNDKDLCVAVTSTDTRQYPFQSIICNVGVNRAHQRVLLTTGVPLAASLTSVIQNVLPSTNNGTSISFRAAVTSALAVILTRLHRSQIIDFLTASTYVDVDTEKYHSECKAEPETESNPDVSYVQELQASYDFEINDLVASKLQSLESILNRLELRSARLMTTLRPSYQTAAIPMPAFSAVTSCQETSVLQPQVVARSSDLRAVFAAISQYSRLPPTIAPTDTISVVTDRTTSALRLISQLKNVYVAALQRSGNAFAPGTSFLSFFRDSYSHWFDYSLATNVHMKSHKLAMKIQSVEFFQRYLVHTLHSRAVLTSLDKSNEKLFRTKFSMESSVAEPTLLTFSVIYKLVPGVVYVSSRAIYVYCEVTSSLLTLHRKKEVSILVLRFEDVTDISTEVSKTAFSTKCLLNITGSAPNTEKQIYCFEVAGSTADYAFRVRDLLQVVMSLPGRADEDERRLELLGSSLLTKRCSSSEATVDKPKVIPSPVAVPSPVPPPVSLSKAYKPITLANATNSSSRSSVLAAVTADITQRLSVTPTPVTENASPPFPTSELDFISATVTARDSTSTSSEPSKASSSASTAGTLKNEPANTAREAYTPTVHTVSSTGPSSSNIVPTSPSEKRSLRAANIKAFLSQSRTASTSTANSK